MTKSFIEDAYDVTTAKSCADALKHLYRGLAPGLILLDLSMPDVDGWETYESIRRINVLHNVPIAIFTSSDNPANRERAQKMGACDSIMKPCGQDELQDRIKRSIKNNC